jgi:hypothetical protein
MYAAAAGHSTLGIPKTVGQEFVAAGPASSNLPEHVKKSNTKKRLGDELAGN